MEDKLKQGEALFAEGKIEEAEKCFLDFLDQNPDDAEALNNLGAIQNTRGNVNEAERYFLKALEAKEDYPDALLNLTDLYQNAKRWEEAAYQLEKFIAIDDQDNNLLNQLGMVYLEIGNTAKAQTALRKSLELNSDQETIRESLERLEKKDMAPNYLPTPSSFRGAFVEINITPNVSEQNPVFLQGMGGPPRKATTVSAPLMMQLLLLEEDHFTKLLFITADLFGFGPEIVDSVRALAAQWGIEPEGLILNASHTHYAPGTISHTSKSIGPFYSEYAKQIVQNIGQQLPILYDKLEECELSWGKADAQIGVSRRLKKDGKVIFAPNPEGYYDKDTPFLLLHMLKTEKKFLLINHGCHPTGLGSENIISADYPGYMRNALKSNGAVDGVMFLQGGAGSTKETVSVNGDEVQFCEDLVNAKENGEILAAQIINGLKKRLQPVKGYFFCTRRQIALPLKPPPPPSVLAQIRDNTGTNDLVREWASSLLNRFPNGAFPATLAMEIQLISLGDKISFVTLPGEPVAELARSLKKLNSNPNNTFVLGYTNGLIGYLPTDAMIEEGGYETEVSQFAYLLPSALDTGTESAIISAIEQCVSAAVDRRRPNGYGRYHLAKKKQEAFFVLSAGRCGTMTLAHLLNTATNARVWHHPQPDPIKESLLAYRGGIDKRKAFWKARYPIIHKTWSEGLIHGETDLLMTPFCDILAEEIPDAKFIVLVRDPRDFVRSGIRRNYYHGHPWDFGRLRPQEGTEESEQWKMLDQFERICWLWVKTYENINNTITRINDNRVLIIRFEDLVKDSKIVRGIFDFLGLEGCNDRKIQGLLSKKFNEQVGGSFPPPEAWSAVHRENLWNLCGTIAKQFGYKRNDFKKKMTKSHSPKEVPQTITSKAERLSKVSIGLAVYSGGEMLSEAIESILSQDYHDFELIISDHGSDPLTKETSLNYQKLDRRIKYIYTGDNLDYLGIQNIARLIELSTAPYFMWASFDDKHEKSFISKCMSRLQEDQSVALVYPRSRVFNEKSEFIGIGQDHVKADQENPFERFKHVIWELNMCNAFYGLFRTHMLRKTRALRHKLYRASDNLLLSEIALFGKIVQIEDILFIRRLTRKRALSFEEQNADVIKSHGQVLLDEGITLPYCRLTYAHCELVNHSKLNRKIKEEMTQEILKCFRFRWKSQMEYEIKRAIKLIHSKQFYYTWDSRAYHAGTENHRGVLQCFHITDILKHLQEAMFIYPEWPELHQAYAMCLHTIDEICATGKILNVAPEFSKER